MSLHLRRASDQYPRACWEPSNDNLVVVSGHTVVGSLKKQIGGTTGERWSWSITCVLIDPDESPRIGGAASREEAQQLACRGLANLADEDEPPRNLKR